MGNKSLKGNKFCDFNTFNLNFIWNYLIEYKFSCKSSPALFLHTCGKEGFWGNLDHFRGYF